MVDQSARRSARLTPRASIPASYVATSLTSLARPLKRARSDSETIDVPSHPRNTSSEKEIPPKKRKAKVQNEPNPEDFPGRVHSDWKVGAHVSAAGGVEFAIANAATIGANAFSLFLRPQQKWAAPPLKPESITSFKARLAAFGYSPSLVLPHGSYLVNLGNPDPMKREQSYACFRDDIRRCELLGLSLYNFHPGSSLGLATPEATMSLIAECINRVHTETSTVITVLENMAGSGNVIGSRFSELGSIIEQVQDKSRIGVCLDTCHMFAAGYDIRTKETYDSTMSEFDNQVGFRFLRGLHLNDSKTPLGSKRDRHENIGQGHIGLQAFAHFLRDPRFQDIPLILETDSGGDSPDSEVWRTEIDVLNRLSLGAPIGDADPKETDAASSSSTILGSEWEGMRGEIERVVKSAASKKSKSKTASAKGSGRKKKFVSKVVDPSGDNQE